MSEQLIRERLAAPFDNVQWRLQQTAPKGLKPPYPEGTRGMFMAYIDARQLYERLDDVFGFGGWQRIVKGVNADGSVIVAISVRIGDEWITHEDIGYSNNPGADHETEPLKAAVSDGAKRAGVGLGIGRFLYELEPKWMSVDKWGKPEGNVNPSTGELPPRTRTTTTNTVPDDPYPYDGQQTRREAAKPAGTENANVATPRQLKYIEVIAREQGIDDEALSREVEQLYGKPIALLDRRDASAYIERLQSRRNVTELAS